MALTIADFCTPGQIRAALGVDEFEITDEVVNDSLMFARFLLYVETLPNFLVVYEASLTAATPTPSQEKLVRAGKLLCVYKVAQILGENLSLVAFKQAEGGRVVNQRFDFDPTIMSRLQANVDLYKGIASEALAAVSGIPQVVRAVSIIARAAGLATDPVTN
jgi:hypothetical protein